MSGSRRQTALLLSLALLLPADSWAAPMPGSTAAQAPGSQQWTGLLVDTRLDERGVLSVREYHDLTVHDSPDWLEWKIAPGRGQHVQILGLTRIEPDHSEHSLRRVGEVSGPDQFAHRDDTLWWSPPRPESGTLGPVQLKLEYELTGALAPAWDLAPAPGTARTETGPQLRNPLERGREVVAWWRVASHCLLQCYRLDQLLPLIGSPHPGLAQTESMELRLDYAGVWRLLPHPDASGDVTDTGRLHIQKTFEHLQPGVPEAVDLDASLLRIGSILVLPLFGIAALLLFVRTRIPHRLRRMNTDRDLFEYHVTRSPPELVATWLRESPPRNAFERMCERLMSEGKLDIELLHPATEMAPARVRLQLNADPDTLHPAERQVLEALFGRATELRSDMHRARHRANGFDPARVANDALRRYAGPCEEHPPPRPTGTAITAIVLATGMGLAAVDPVIHGYWPFALAGGVLGLVLLLALTPRRWWHPGRNAAMALWWLLPLGALTAYAVLLHLLPALPLGATASAGLALTLTAGFFHLLLRTRGCDARMEARYTMGRFRDWARAQLRRARPELDDAWQFHLDALGLGSDLSRWRRRHAGREEARPPALGTDNSLFTGTRATPALPDGWSLGLYVTAKDDDLGLF